MKIGFIVQARLGSTRLPGKILLPFYKEKTILDIIIDNLREIENTSLVVATSVASANDELINFLKSRGVDYYRGSENDVLDRFICAANKFGIEGVVRICSDNPFLDVDDMKKLINKAREGVYDYIGYRINGLPSIKTHFGFWGEFVRLSALEKITRLSTDMLYHEHVTNYIYTHPDMFNIGWLEVPTCLQNRIDIRLTVDTKEDFTLTQRIYSKMKTDKGNFKTLDVVDYLDNNKDLLERMKQQITCNIK